MLVLLETLVVTYVGVVHCDKCLGRFVTFVLVPDVRVAVSLCLRHLSSVLPGYHPNSHTSFSPCKLPLQA